MAYLSNLGSFVAYLLVVISDGLVYCTLLNATSVKVGYLWTNPRLESIDSSEAVMDKKLANGVLHLLCSISPPLPKDEEHWEKKNELVTWVKVKPKYEVVHSARYWSNDMAKTAVSLDNVTLDDLGTYSCNYGGLSASIDVLVANVEVAATLRKPRNLLELKTYVTFMKDKSGLNGWSKDQTQLLTSVGTRDACSGFEKPHQTSTSVHQLHISDVKVIAAMGDTFTVGLGTRATTLNDFFTEYKDVSWSIGGYGHLNQSITLPNIMKQFNPLLKGASEGYGRSMIPDLNVAFVGASAKDLKDQAIDLVSRLKKMKDVDYQKDWKLVTIWIGTDDLCHVCRDKDTYSPGLFIKYVMHTLRYLQEEVPRLFVNLVPPMDVTSLYQLRASNCKILGWDSCECVATQSNADRRKVSQVAREYKRLQTELVDSGLYDTQETFIVVHQPALHALPTDKNGQVMKDYFGLDCLHFSAKGHAAAALSLWKNMLEPYGTKTEQWGDMETLKCPSKEMPFLFTKKNSNTVSSHAIVDEDDEDSVRDFPPTAAVALAVCFTAVVVIVAVIVWRSRRSRRRPEALKLLYAPGLHRPRI